MAQTCVGDSIFSFFWTPEDYYGTFEMSLSSKNTSFSASRATFNDEKSDTESSLSSSYEYGTETITLTTTNYEAPTLDISTSKFENKGVSLTSSLQQPNISLDASYNAQKKYYFNINTSLNAMTQKANSLSISSSYDILKASNLLFCADWNLEELNSDEKANKSSFNIGVEYNKSNRIFAVKTKDNFNGFDVGISYEKGDNTFYGQVGVENDDDKQEKKKFIGLCGMSRKIDDNSSVDVMVNNEYFAGVRYNSEIKGFENGLNLNGSIGANFDFNPANNGVGAKLQYTLSLGLD